MKSPEKKFFFLFSALLIVVLIYSSLYAVTSRAYEPVIIKGAEFQGFLNISHDNLVVYSYSDISSDWTAISFQIDDLDSDNDYMFSGQDNLLTANDELLVLANDCGDVAPSSSWISDESSRNYPRYQVQVHDPLSGDDGYVYVYRTDNKASHPVATDYIQYDSSIDRVESQFYEIAHNASNGIMTTLLLTNAGGGNGEDFVDRFKIRVRGSYDLGFLGSVTLVLSEENLTKQNASGIEGQIRVVRNWKIQLEVPELQGAIDLPVFDYIVKYYPTSCDMGSFRQLKIPADADVDFLRLSYDLDPSANGMHMFAENAISTKPNGSLVNRTTESDDIGIPRDLNIPGWNWWMQTGAPGTLLGIAELPDVAVNQYLYYKDDLTGTNDSPLSGDQAFDTGVNGSWGDTGVKYTGSFSQESRIDIQLWLYFLGANISPDSAAVIKSFHEHPIGADNITLSEQNFPVDTIKPAKIADLQVSNSGQDFVTLSWTAPGDDGNAGGPAYQYQMKYSTALPIFGLETWWNGAAFVENMPSPAEPGQTQSITINNLTMNKRYYFYIRSSDEYDNWSDFSNLAGQNTSPVELSLFTAKQSNDHVELVWITESETNNLGFAVERKSQTQNSWQEIVFINGAGTTTSGNRYSFTDKINVTGTVMYRLRQVDTDGSVEYSEIVNVAIKAPQEFALFQNYPNPFNPVTRIAYQIPDNLSGNVRLDVYDVLGRQLRTLVNTPAQAGYYETIWDGFNDSGQEAGSGEYFYVLKIGNLQQIRKMIKLQ